MHGWANNNETTSIRHHGDYSGEVIIRRQTVHGEPRGYKDEDGNDLEPGEFSVPFEDLRDFILDYFRQEMVARWQRESIHPRKCCFHDAC